MTVGLCPAERRLIHGAFFPGLVGRRQQVGDTGRGRGAVVAGGRSVGTTREPQRTQRKKFEDTELGDWGKRSEPSSTAATYPSSVTSFFL